MGRKRHKPTETTREIVNVMLSHGLTQVDVAKVLRLDPKTLRRHYSDEIETASIIAMSEVAKTAYKMAISGQYPAMTMFLLKTRLGWRETSAIAHTGKDDGPIEVNLDYRADLISRFDAIAQRRAETDVPVEPD